MFWKAPQRLVMTRTVASCRRKSGRDAKGLIFVSMGGSCCDDDHQLGDEEDEADGEHTNANEGGPGEFEVRAPVEDHECDSAEEQDGADPSPETSRDLALDFVLAAANLAEGLDG